MGWSRLSLGNAAGAGGGDGGAENVGNGGVDIVPDLPQLLFRQLRRLGLCLELDYILERGLDEAIELPLRSETLRDT